MLVCRILNTALLLFSLHTVHPVAPQQCRNSPKFTEEASCCPYLMHGVHLSVTWHNLWRRAPRLYCGWPFRGTCGCLQIMFQGIGMTFRIRRARQIKPNDPTTPLTGSGQSRVNITMHSIVYCVHWLKGKRSSFAEKSVSHFVFFLE